MCFLCALTHSHHNLCVPPQHWKSHAVFLYLLLPLLLLIIVFSGITLYNVYVKEMDVCRSVVLLSLVVVLGVIVTCIMLARSKERIFLITGHRNSEVAGLFALLCFFIMGALLLGWSNSLAAPLGSDVNFSDDLANNPFKLLSSRCQPKRAWQLELSST